MWNKWSIEIAVIVCLTLLISPLVGIAQATYENPELITYPDDVILIVDYPEEYPNTVILDTRGNADYNINHIPGAINILDKFQYSNSTLKPVEEATAILGDNGINESNEVIIYGTPYHYVFWMLEYLGHENVSILDGGFETWNSTYPDNVTNTPTSRNPTTYNATPNESRIATTLWLLNNLENPDVQILDARRESEYNVGHIPGALNLNFYELLEEENQMKSADNLSKLFNDSVVDSKGEVVSLNKSKEIVVYCKSGGRASSMYFALRLMDYTVRNYEESMKIWDDEQHLPLDIQLKTNLPNVELVSADLTVRSINVTRLNLSEINGTCKPEGVRCQCAYMINSTGLGNFTLRFTNITDADTIIVYKINETNQWVELEGITTEDAVTFTMSVGDPPVVFGYEEIITAQVPALTPVGITALAGLLLVIGGNRIKKKKRY